MKYTRNFKKGRVCRGLAIAFVCLLPTTAIAQYAFNTVHVAKEDGFVSATAAIGTCKGSGSHWAYQTLHGFREGQKLAYEEAWDNERELSILYPVRKGDHWSVRVYCQQAQKNIRFIPVGQSVIGASRTRSFNTVHTAQKPGVVVASGYTGSCRGKGSPYTYQNLTGFSGQQGMQVRGFEATWGEWRAVSLTFPVSRGEKWKVDTFCPPPYNKQYGATAALYFVELDQVENAFLKSRTIAANKNYQAQEDGFLIASGWTGACKQYGYTNQTLKLIDNGSEVAREEAWGEWRAVSATIPVQAGHTYRAQFFCRDEASHVNVQFVPFSLIRGACSDGQDNDNDGLTDLADPGCSGPDDGDERNPQGPACDNGIDDDNDSVADFPNDPGCDSPRDSSETDPQASGCDDGIDNDGDGLTDYPADPGCETPFDESERDPNGPQCDNGKDDDADGKKDFPADPDCTDPTDTTERPDSSGCSDGIDNDGDGLTDHPQDPGCSSPSDSSERDPSGPACDDGRDNDRDGKIDFPSDPGCSNPTDLTEYTDGGPACDNGIDDDLDGLIDFPLDPDCSDATDESEQECCSNESGTQCNDGVDNDCDGTLDSEDSDCATTECPLESWEERTCDTGLPGICQQSKQMRLCSWQGFWLPWTECLPSHVPGEKAENCYDLVDNDCDGLVDYADSDC